MNANNENARNQARAQFESIKEMVEALNLDWDRLEELREEKAELARIISDDDDAVNQAHKLNGHERAHAELELREWLTENEEELSELESEAGDYKDSDDARQRINEDPLSVQVRSDWHDPGSAGEATEFQILLCTGGPAVKIEGSLNQYGEPESASIFYQDWFTPWEALNLTHEEQEIVLEYCRCFYFGE